MVQFLLVSLLAFIPGQEPEAQIQFAQVAPPAPAGQALTRSSNQTRAVVLIQGLRPPKKGEAKTEMASYQQPTSPVVKRLSPLADVFALAYEQTIPVTAFAGLPDFRRGIQVLREHGYTEIVLVGFGAGGLIARQFVEDVPDSGVTKVIQVDTMNLGGGETGDSHDVFQRSLSREARQAFLNQRPEKKISDAIQFACVIGSGLVDGDSLARNHWTVASKWPGELQAQGIQARLVTTKYMWSSRTEEGARTIAEMVPENLFRWNAKATAAMRERLVGITVTPPN